MRNLSAEASMWFILVTGRCDPKSGPSCKWSEKQRAQRLAMALWGTGENRRNERACVTRMPRFLAGMN